LKTYLVASNSFPQQNLQCVAPLGLVPVFAPAQRNLLVVDKLQSRAKLQKDRVCQETLTKLLYFPEALVKEPLQKPLLA
jgi:hypothetical protein